jgi:hypothetical protein
MEVKKNMDYLKIIAVSALVSIGSSVIAVKYISNECDTLTSFGSYESYKKAMIVSALGLDFRKKDIFVLSKEGWEAEISEQEKKYEEALKNIQIHEAESTSELIRLEEQLANNRF